VAAQNHVKEMRNDTNFGDALAMLVEVDAPGLVVPSANNSKTWRVDDTRQMPVHFVDPCSGAPGRQPSNQSTTLDNHKASHPVPR